MGLVLVLKVVVLGGEVEVVASVRFGEVLLGGKNRVRLGLREEGCNGV